MRRLSRRTGEVWVPKAGWMRFRWSRAVPPGVKSYRVTMDRAGRWHAAFAAIPAPVPAPGNGQRVGIDRGVAVAALSTGDLLHAPGLTGPERARLRRLERTLARAKRGSNRRGRVRQAIARLRARERDRRKDWAEKTSTYLARRFDVIRVEDLRIAKMTQSAKGTRECPGRVEKINAACTACGYAGNADVNAARNAAAGLAVTARGGLRDTGPANREPHLLASFTG